MDLIASVRSNQACSKCSHYMFQGAFNKGTDQTARMLRLIRAFVVRVQRREEVQQGV